MAILILGANGFIGSAVLARLCDAGHEVVGLGRDIGHARNRFPAVRWLRADLATMTRKESWAPVLAGITAVVNCAGALQDGLRDDIRATQRDAMLALYAAAKDAGIARVVQISARLENGADTAFIATKADADAALKQSGLAHVILRPSLVLGRNAYGGSALLRALSALPFLLPLVYANQQVHTVALDDVADAVTRAVDGRLASGTDLELSGGALGLAELVQLHRAWLGLAPARIVPLPAIFATGVSWLADLAGRLGWRSPLRTTAMRVMAGGIDAARTDQALALRSPAQTLAAHPAGVQDLWFARLYLLKPMLIVVLALFWLASGSIPFLDLGRAAMHFEPYMPRSAALGVTVATSLLDMALGLLVLYRPLARTALLAQVGLALSYLIGGTLLEPVLWLDPLGPYVKVLPAIFLSLATLAILDER